MSDLTDKLAKLLAFDSTQVQFDSQGEAAENARLQPLHEKLLRCVEALEKTPTSHSILCNSLRCPEHCARAAKDAALAELRKECGE